MSASGKVPLVSGRKSRRDAAAELDRITNAALGGAFVASLLDLANDAKLDVGATLHRELRRAGLVVVPVEALKKAKAVRS